MLGVLLLTVIFVNKSSNNNEEKMDVALPIEKVSGIVKSKNELEIQVVTTEGENFFLDFSGDIYDFSEGVVKLSEREINEYVNKFELGDEVILEFPVLAFSESKIVVENINNIRKRG